MPKRDGVDDKNFANVMMAMTADQLIIWYDADKNIAMDLSGKDWDIVNGFLGDVNFWAQFLTSLSGALANPGKFIKSEDKG